jgi:hypothetical protein
MPTLSGINKMKFEEFKKEAKVLNLKSKETNKTRRIIKWRDKTFNIADLHIVFNLIKNEL